MKKQKPTVGSILKKHIPHYSSIYYKQVFLDLFDKVSEALGVADGTPSIISDRKYKAIRSLAMEAAASMKDILESRQP